MLFQRILQNVIRDFTAARKCAACGQLCCPPFGTGRRRARPLEVIESADSDHKSESPHAQFEQQQTLTAIEKEIENFRHVNAKPSSCVTGKKWTSPKNGSGNGCSGSVKHTAPGLRTPLPQHFAAKGITP